MKNIVKKDDLLIYNEYFDIILNNLDKYEYEEIFDMARMSFVHRKKLLNYLFKEYMCLGNKEIENLKYYLIDSDMYNEFVENIINGNDEFLKISLALYYEPKLKEIMFNDNNKVIDSIINSNEDEYLKLNNLLHVSKFKCSKETYKYLKDNFRNLLFEFNKEEKQENNDRILAYYYKIMDNWQNDLNNYIVVRKKELKV